MRPTAGVVGSVIAVTLFAAGGARGDDTNDLEKLLDENVVSTASKNAEVQSVAPAFSTVISAEDLRAYGIHSLDEAINFLATGMVVEDPGDAHDMEVGARGVQFTRDYGDHVLLLVNGHSMNEQWDGTMYIERGTAIPMEIIDHIEVILGPGSVLYGSNAVLGVVNVVTKRAKDWSGGHVVVEGQIPTSIRAGAGFGKEFEIGGTRGEVTFAAEYFAQNGPFFTYGPQNLATPQILAAGQPPSSVWGGEAKNTNWSQIPSGYLRAFVGPFELNVRAAIFERSVIPGDSAFDDRDDHERDRWLQGDLRHHVLLTPRAELTSRLYGDSYDYREHLNTPDPSGCLTGQTRGCEYDLLGLSRWAGLEEQFSYDWLGDASLTTLVGVDGRLRYFGSQTDYSELNTGFNPGSLNVYEKTEKAIAIYLEQQYSPTKWLHLNAGARFDGDEAYGAALSPRFAAAVAPWDGASVKLLYAEAFRAATGYERFYADPTYEVAAPNLKPEKVRSIEARFEQRVGATRLFCGVFRSWWLDLISSAQLTKDQLNDAIASGALQAGTSAAYQYENVDRVDSYGFDAGFEASALSRRLRFGASMTGASARQYQSPEDPGSALPVAAQLFGNARAAFDLGKDLPTLAVVGRIVGARPADGYQDGYTPVPYAKTLEQAQVTASGKVFFVPGLGYRASAMWTPTKNTPYVVGPGDADGHAELAQYDRFRATVGLWYDFGG